MKLNEFVGSDGPSDKIHVGLDIIEEMLHRKDEIDTDAFLYCFKNTMNMLPPIATERAFTRDWEEHPMFGIASSKCTDQRAQEYQSVLAMAERIFSVLLERAETQKGV